MILGALGGGKLAPQLLAFLGTVRPRAAAVEERAQVRVWLIRLVVGLADRGLLELLPFL